MDVSEYFITNSGRAGFHNVTDNYVEFFLIKKIVCFK